MVFCVCVISSLKRTLSKISKGGTEDLDETSKQRSRVSGSSANVLFPGVSCTGDFIKKK